MLKAIEAAERDKKIALALLFVGLIVVSSIVGFGFGQFDVQKEAVQNRHADFVVDQNNNLVFKWRAAR